jgi:O-antigen ligase
VTPQNSSTVKIDSTGISLPTGQRITAPQFIVSGSAPSIAAGAAAGTGPTATITAGGNNEDHVVNLTTGTATTTGTLATVTFSTTLSAAPIGCQMTARNAATAPTMTSVYTGAPSTTTYTISTATALNASTAYVFTMHCQ